MPPKSIVPASIDRNNDETTSPGDELAIPSQAGARDAGSKSGPTRTYGNTQISGQSRPVLGDVFNTHNHFYSSEVAWYNVQSSGGTPANDCSGLYISSTKKRLSPDSISEYNAYEEQLLRSTLRLPGTCDWLFRVEQYKSWHNGNGPPILVWTGSVGCGKSIAASAVIDSLQADAPDMRCPVASYFVNTASNLQITATDILRALVKQLMLIHEASRQEYSQGIQESIWRLLSVRDEILTTAILTQLVVSLVQDIEGCIFVVDGIDAMQEFEILAFTRFLRNVFASSPMVHPKCQMILFCRETLGRGFRLESIPQSCVFHIQVNHVRSDIHSYVDREITRKQDERSISNDVLLIDEVRRTLKKNADKMFLWVKLQILTIWDPNYTTCDSDIRTQLRELPDKLDGIYIRCLERIEASNEERSGDIAPKIFKWVACAKEPLTPVQAREAINANPENLPIHASKVLTNPVTDYCANLVILNHLTGTVTFPHPTVKDFLCDQSKLPPHLHKYHVALEADDLWLGEICLAYVKVLQNSKSLIQYRKPTVDSGIPSNLLQNTILPSLPFRWSRKRANLSRTTITVPVPPPSTRQGLLGPYFSMHGYLFKHWLEHNRKPASSDSTHKMFSEVCLSHDVELQPWIEGANSEIERYRQTVQHAVMTDHVQLLLVVRDHLAPFKDTLWTQVFLRPCPGTDSSFLHVAAALGHTKVIPTLLDACGKHIADSRGRSAAAVAAENYQSEAFSLLAPDDGEWKSDCMWQLNDHAKKCPRWMECLLHVCAACGNADAIAVLVERLRRFTRNSHSLTRKLFESFILACFKGHMPAALYLVTLGVSPDGSDGVRQFPYAWSGAARGFIDERRWKILLSWEGSSLSLALLMEDPALMENLLACGASFSNREDHCDVPDVIQRYDGRDNIVGAKRFIEILFKHKELAEGDQFVSWPERILASIDHRLLQSVRIWRWSRFMRLIMQLPGDHVSSTFCLPLQGLMPRDMVDVLEYAPDDLLLRMMNYGWFDEEFLLTPTPLQALFRRGTSRALEALIDHSGLTSVLVVQALGLTSTSLTLAELFEYRVCGSSRCKQAWRNETLSEVCSSTRFSSMGTEIIPQTLRHALDQAWSHHLDCRHGSSFTTYQSLLKDRLGDARHCGMYSVSEFVDYYLHRKATCFHVGCECLNAASRPNLVAEANFASQPKPSPLMWHRCYRKANGNAIEALEVYANLLQIGSQANFALNWPAGYMDTIVVSDAGKLLQTKDGAMLAVKLSIQIALYRWNFRLNRSKRKAFSMADLWFMGVKIMMGIRRRKAQAVDQKEQPQSSPSVSFIFLETYPSEC